MLDQPQTYPSFSSMPRGSYSGPMTGSGCWLGELRLDLPSLEQLVPVDKQSLHRKQITRTESVKSGRSLLVPRKLRRGSQDGYTARGTLAENNGENGAHTQRLEVCAEGFSCSLVSCYWLSFRRPPAVCRTPLLGHQCF